MLQELDIGNPITKSVKLLSTINLEDKESLIEIDTDFIFFTLESK